MSGVLISLESLDGGGKSSVADHLSDSLDDVVVTKEPSDLWTGGMVREALEDDEASSAYTFMAFMLDRIHHIEEVIKPALENGRVVISDRYSDSSRAYQSTQLTPLFDSGRSGAWPYINSVMAPWTVTPDLTLYLDISVDTALERCDRGDKYENRENLEQVKKNYDLVNRLYQGRIRTVDAERPLDEVKQECLEIVQGEIE